MIHPLIWLLVLVIVAGGTAAIAACLICAPGRG